MSCWNGWDVIPWVWDWARKPVGIQGLLRAVREGVTAKAWENHTVGRWDWEQALRGSQNRTGVLETLPTEPWPVCPCPFGLEEWCDGTKLFCEPQLCCSPCPAQVAVCLHWRHKGGVLLFEVRDLSLAPPKQQLPGKSMQRGNGQDNVRASARSRAAPLQGALANTARTCENTAQEQKSSTLYALLQSFSWAWLRSVGWYWLALVFHL